MTNTRPALTEKRIDDIRRIIRENPEMTRTQISKSVCELWEWQSLSGQLKDISARDMLRALDKAGTIALPPPRIVTRKAGTRAISSHLDHDTSLIKCSLRKLTPLNVEIVEGGSELKEFKSIIDQYHYLGFSGTVGENMKYAIRSASGKLLALLLFGSAAWSCHDRDVHIGWDKERRREALYLISNNHRFLVFPWVYVPCLASHILSIIVRRISNDWQDKYGHGLLAIETFVDNSRFRAVCYRAANFKRLGKTTGRGRDGGHHNAILPEKDIYIYPLDNQWLKKLRGV